MLRVLLFLVCCSNASAADIYFAQASAGSNNGTNCANAFSVGRFNTADSNWTSGNILHLCGTWTGTTSTNLLTTQGAGTSGHPITILFESGAILNAPAWGTFSTNPTGGAIVVQNQWITVDLGSNGLIENTRNGTTGASCPGGACNIHVVSAGIYVVASNVVVQASGGQIGPIFTRTPCAVSTEDAANYGVFIDGNNGGALTNITVQGVIGVDVGNTLTASVGSSGISNIAFLNNTLSRASAEIVVAAGGGAGTASNITISGNNIFDNYVWWDPADNDHLNGMHLFAAAGGAALTGVSVNGNYVHGDFGGTTCGGGGSHTTALIFIESTGGGTDTNPLIFNNLLVSGSGDDPSDGLLNPGDSGTTGAQIYNNTFVGANDGSGYCMIIDGSFTAKNNICSGLSYAIYIGGAGVSQITASNNNLFFQNSNGFNAGSGPISFASWRALSGNPDANSLNGSDPILNSNGTLRAGSPAIGVGANLTSLTITNLDSDKAGIARPSAAPWDVGAYQFVSAPSCGSYSHCRLITFDHTKVGAVDIANYPALISGTYSYLAVTGSGGQVQHTATQTPGGAAITVPADLIYTSDPNCATKLPWEFETYSSTTGAVNLYVNVGTMTHLADKVIYECAGNAGVTTWQGNVAGTWVNYMLVQHLPNGTTLSAQDSAHSNNGSIVGATAVAGQIDGAGNFPGGAGNLITIGDDNTLSTTGAMTMSGWYNAGANLLVDDGALVEKSTTLANGEYFFGPLGSFGNRIYCFFLDETNGGYIGRAAPQPSAGWHYVICPYDGGATNASVKIYSDGVQIDTMDFGAGTFVQMRNTTQAVLLGGRHAAIGGPLTAIADEIRVAAFDRSASITADFNNQSSPSTFYTVGPDIPGGPGAPRRRLIL